MYLRAELLGLDWYVYQKDKNNNVVRVNEMVLFLRFFLHIGVRITLAFT